MSDGVDRSPGSGSGQEGAGRMVLRCYTTGRRHPQVIGRIGGTGWGLGGRGWTPPWGVASVTQYVVGLSVFMVLLVTRMVWAHLGLVGNTLAIVVLPFAAAFLTRRARIDQRSLAATLVALLGDQPASRDGLYIGAHPRD